MITIKKQSQRLTAPEAAEYLRVKPKTMNYWRSKKTGPRYYKIGKRFFYSIADLDAYIETRAVEPSAA